MKPVEVEEQKAGDLMTILIAGSSWRSVTLTKYGHTFWLGRRKKTVVGR